MLSRLKKYFSSTPYPNEDLNFRDIFKPLYILLSVLGLFPYSVTFCSRKKYFNIIHKSIYINSLCGVTIVLIMYSFLTLHIEYLFESSESNIMADAILTQMNYIVELVLLLIFCTVTYICTFLNRYTYVKILNKVISSWIELPNSSADIILGHLRYQVNVIAMGTLFTVFVLQICVNYSRHGSIWKIAMVTITFNLPQMIQLVFIAFYYVLVMMIVALLANIKEHCIRFLKNKTNFPGTLINVETRLSTVTLRQMELVYVKAFEIKRDINRAFQAPILVTTVQCFHAIVSESHIIYHGIVIERSLSTHDIVNCSLWIFYQLLKIAALAYSGSLLKLQVARFGQALHDIPTDKQDIRLLMEVQHFSTLMSYQGTELTVYGYFPLDATLLYNPLLMMKSGERDRRIIIVKIIASATTYLIILVQFDKSNFIK